MAALTANRDTKELYHPAGMDHERLAGSSDEFYIGQMVCIDVDATGSPLVPAAAGDLTLRVVGRSETRLTAGAGNTSRLKYRSGIFKWNNGTAGEAIDANDVGKVCYVLDDNTVGISGNSAANAIAGRIYQVDADGVWVATLWPEAPVAGATAGA